MDSTDAFSWYQLLVFFSYRPPTIICIFPKSQKRSQMMIFIFGEHRMCVNDHLHFSQITKTIVTDDLHFWKNIECA